MANGRLNRSEIARIVGGDPRAIREFERIIGQVQANITGPSSISLNYGGDGALTSSLPVSEAYTLSADDGTTFNSGVSWGVTVLSGSFSGTGPTIGGTGRGVLYINSGLATPTALVAVTARVNGVGYPAFSVTVGRDTAPPETPSGGSTPTDSTSSFTTFSTSSFVAITRNLEVTLPSGVTEATLFTGNLLLDVVPGSPTGVTQVEMKWQNETAPSVWSDVGSVATSASNPTVIDEGGGFFSTNEGEIICNRTATGLGAGSAQKFRLVARVSGGNVRSVSVFGTAGVTS